MPKLFTPTRIKNLALPNRFIRSATWEGLATEDGACTPELVDLMEDLTGGNPGLIITGHTYVSPTGQATLRQLGVDNDSRIEGLSEMTAAVHRKGGRIMMQLAHGGLRADAKFSNMTPMGPSAAQGLIEPPGCEMTRPPAVLKRPALTGFKYMPPTAIYSVSFCHPHSTNVLMNTAID